MSIYDDFARIYCQGEYPDFSRKMADLLPAVLQQLDAGPRRVLDVACGEGSFAIALAKKGIDVTGVDISSSMLEHAREMARKAGADVEFVHGDMRSLNFADSFDLATCWFDSLNYLTEPGDLRETFRSVHRALHAGGLFIFDMNTIYGLAVNWREYPCYIQQDDNRVFEIHRAEYDFESDIATMHITGFINSGGGWERIDEEHHERGYSQDDVRDHLMNAGFQVLASWGSFSDMSEARPDSGRVWYVARRGGI
jgi:ubiquinone/menaquinone biosynthesis C-methylase UbiE